GEETYVDTLVLDTGRTEPVGARPNALSFELHGEYEVRYRAMSDLPLTPPASAPGATTLGQNQYLYHWLRLTPAIHYRDKLSVVGQIDVPRGLVVGDTTQYATAAREPLDEQKPFRVEPRYLYIEYLSSIGMLRVGQQGSHWGMGILANDGDHPPLFGDYVGGSLVDRVLFATTPMGKGTPLAIAVAADMVFQDPTAHVLPDETGASDRAFQGVVAALWRTKPAEIGVYGVLRHQERDEQAAGAFTPFVDSLTVGVVDVAGKFHAPIAGSRAFLYGEMEAAAIFGSTDFLRDTYAEQSDPTGKRVDERVGSYGGAATLGAVRVAGSGDERWGSVVGEIELGYASGDADPYDGDSKRFTFDPNHTVGLVLFRQVLAWKTARAATNASDPNLVARAAPGIQLLPSNGGVFGAAYLNPRAVFRPRRWVDLKIGAVIAQTTSDFVDPYHFGALGSAKNYDGGDPRKHDLGLELDGGFDVRIPADRHTTVQLGAEGGVLFPGHAFDDAAGHALPDQLLLNTKAGIQF
ncbi:MAG TPA: hypothetical protein VHB21_07690, partial [Minicystis sp.]|nr:hypothetical protein [Minicystis sp.]